MEIEDDTHLSFIPCVVSRAPSHSHPPAGLVPPSAERFSLACVLPCAATALLAERELAPRIPQHRCPE